MFLFFVFVVVFRFSQRKPSETALVFPRREAFPAASRLNRKLNCKLKLEFEKLRLKMFVCWAEDGCKCRWHVYQGRRQRSDWPKPKHEARDAALLPLLLLLSCRRSCWWRKRVFPESATFLSYFFWLVALYALISRKYKFVLTNCIRRSALRGVCVRMCVCTP